MTIYNDAVASIWSKPAAARTFEAMGAAERTEWSSFVRQGHIDQVIAAVNDAATYGVMVIGPWGVGKTTLARAVEKAVAPTTHIVRLFGPTADAVVSYGPLALFMARLHAAALDSPTTIIQGIDELIRTDAGGRPVLLVIDEPHGLDPMTVGVLMHLLLSGAAKLMVLARDTAELPEDLVWLAKDGLLGEMRLEYFSRAEVAELIAKATDSFVSESAVTALYNASAGVPLVLHALFREQAAKGGLRRQRGGWVVTEPMNLDADSALADVVRSRMSRETEAVRTGVEKLSLLGNAPLPVAISALGQETLWQLEERGFVVIGATGGHRVELVERYVGDIVRSTLTPERMAALFAEIAGTFNQELSALDARERMALAAWTLDAGLVLDHEFGLAAAESALRHFDPLLALRCTALVPAGHHLRVRAVRLRCAAYKVLAEYDAAVEELSTVPDRAVAALPVEEYGRWVLTNVGALLWVADGSARIRQLLDTAEERLCAENVAGRRDAVRAAQRLVDLARLEYEVHRGRFAEALAPLEAAVDDDAAFRLNASCLLVPVLAVTGRELEAIALGRRIEEDIAERGTVPLLYEYARDGLANARIWSGQWLDCVDMLHDELEGTSQPVLYRGGLIELKLGLAHAYAGRGEEAVQVLMAATAQLEARDSDNALMLAYAALAFCFAQTNNEEEARRHLALAGTNPCPTQWTNHAMWKFFRYMALRWLEDDQAAAMLEESAANDMAKGRYATASMSLFGAYVQGSEKDYALLEEVSLRRQGPMPTVNVLLARSARTRNAATALQAAAIAESLRLDAVESRCAVLALDFARDKGENSLVREASQRLDRLSGNLVKLPVKPQIVGAKLTQRELQVARLAKRGLGNRAIADRIGVSVRTVEGHLYQVYSKLGITTRQELAEDRDI